MAEAMQNREGEIKAEWGHVAKTMVVKAHGMMQEHIHHVQRDLTAHMEDCLDHRTAEISQQKTLEAAAKVSAIHQDAVQHVQQQGAQVMQEAHAKVSAHMTHAERTVEKIIVAKTVAVVQEAQAADRSCGC